MFRKMRRRNQQLSDMRAAKILSEGSHGVLALAGDCGYPYAVPISYAFDGEKLFFHCANEGHKLDSIKRSPKASFCVVGRDSIVPSEYTTRYESVIAFGKIRVLEDEGEKLSAMLKLAEKYCSQIDKAERRSEIQRAWRSFVMLEMTPEHISGKASGSLVQNREASE